MIVIDGVEYRTVYQWERKRRHVLESEFENGLERSWRSPEGNVTMSFYEIAQTVPWTEEERDCERQERREERRRKRAEQAAREAEEERKRQARLKRLSFIQHAPLGQCCEGDRTAWQWVDRGYVPWSGARWHVGEGHGGFWSCSAEDVRWNPDRAAKLKESGPVEYDRLPDGRPYDGRPWW